MMQEICHRPSVADRFWAKVRKTDTCWLWTASGDRNGYGLFWNGDKLVYAHRYAYELLVGPIPAGLTIDHLCETPACVWPTHLEPVMLAVNILRGNGPTAINARKTHCPQRHPLLGGNLYIRPDGSGRDCLTCRRVRNRRRGE
jgi:hypothetical protein